MPTGTADETIASTDARLAIVPEDDDTHDGYIVKLRDDIPVIQSFYADVDRIGSENLLVVDSLEQAQHIEEEYIEYIEPNYYVELFTTDTPTYTPNDPYYLSHQWGLQNIGAMTAHERGLMGEGVTIGIIDSGINRNHEDLDANRINGLNFHEDGLPYDKDNFGHGTFVAGIIAAQTDNGVGLAGIAPNTTVMAYRVFSGRTTTMDTVVNALYRAVEDGCDIINMSLGTVNQSNTLRTAVEWAQKQGVIVVAAAGNNGSSVLQYPAAYPDVIGVGSVDKDMRVSTFSQRNSTVDVTAPGGGVLGLDNIATDGYKLDLTSKSNMGTSFAAPVVSGMIALALGYDSDITEQGIRYLLESTVDDAGASGYDAEYGYGIVNVTAFVDELQREFAINYELDDGMFATDAVAAYRVTDSTLPLPTPVRPSWMFTGWYRDKEAGGSPVTTIPAGSLGDVTLYATWQRDEGAAVDTVSVNGIPATLQEDGKTYEVYLPFGTALTAFTGAEITVRPSKPDSQVSSPQTTDGGNHWSFTVTGASSTPVTYTLRIRLEQLHVAEGQQTQTGIARPASLDTLTAAVPYIADAAAWFQYGTEANLPGDFTCIASVEEGEGTLTVEGSKLTYMPAGADAGKSVRLHVQGASNGRVAGDVTVTLTVDAIPPSQPTVVQSVVSFDRDTMLQVEIPLMLFGNPITGVVVDSVSLEETQYRLGDISTDGTSALIVDGGALTSLSDGFYMVYIFFGTEEPLKVMLEIKSGIPRYTITFQSEDKIYSRADAVREGTVISLPTPPSRQGYTFDGWYTEQNGGTRFAEQTPVHASLTVYAHWSANTGGGSAGGGGGSGGGGSAGGGGAAGGGGSQAAEAPMQDSANKIMEIDGTIQFTRVEQRITAEQSVVLVDYNSKAAIELQTEALHVVVPAGTLSKGFDVNRLLPDWDSAANISGQVLICTDDSGERHVLPWVIIQPDGVTFTASRAGTYEIIDAGLDFNDVSGSAWYAEAVSFVSARGLLRGTGQTHFEPEGSLTRGMLMTGLARLDGVNTAGGAVWYEAGMKWAMDAGVSDGSNPGGRLTREQAAAMLWRYADSPVVNGTLDGFTDAEQCSDYAVTAIGWAIQQGILTGDGEGRLDPQGEITRAQLAAMLIRFVQSVQNTAYT